MPAKIGLSLLRLGKVAVGNAGILLLATVRAAWDTPGNAEAST